MTPLELIELSAATWYIAYAVTKTHGPFGIFEKLREFKGGRWHGRTIKWIEQPPGVVPTFLQTGNDGLLDCIICLSIWVALVFTLLTRHSIIDAFAVAGLALWAHGYFGWRINM
jgi:hypothetical protein